MDWPDQSALSGSSSDEEEVPFGTIAAGYEPLPDELRSPDSVTEASLADLCHSSGSSDRGEEEGDDTGEEPAAEGGWASFPSAAGRSPSLQQRHWQQQQQGVGQPGAPPSPRGPEAAAGSSGLLAAVQDVGGGATGEVAVPSSSRESRTAVQGGPAIQSSTCPEQLQAAAAAPEVAGGSLVEEPASRRGGAGEGGGAGVLDEERRAAILAAMQRFQLSYRPAWAEIVPEESWMRRLRQGGTA